MVTGLLSCDGCAFFQVGSAVLGDGLCRKNPPGVYVYPEFEDDDEEEASDVDESGEVEDDGEEDEEYPVEVLFSERVYVGWPEVELQDWCGSFVERGNSSSFLKNHPIGKS
jgi:hypothetical protein